MNFNRILAVIAFLALSLRLTAASTPLGTAFTYQGRLQVSGNPATGLYDFQVALYDAATGTNSFGTNTLAAVAVANGLYTITLDFGSSAFDGNARWLDFSVRTNGNPNWTLLTPRQPVSPTPYALKASGLIGTLPDSQLSSNIPRLNGANAFTGPNAFNGALFVLSSNLVANLNADFLDGLHGSGYALAAHTHDGSNIVSGTLPSGRLSGTYTNALTFNNPGNLLYGDGTHILGITSTPTGYAGGVLSGSYPNPSIAAGAITDSMVSATANINASKIFGGDLGAARLKVGSSHTLSGSGATIGGGTSNVVDAAGTFATIPGGAQARAFSYGQQAYSSGSFVTNGDAQSSLFILRNTTTNSSVLTELFLDGVGQRILIPTNANWAIDIVVVARSASGFNVAYNVAGLIYKVGANLNAAIGVPLLRGSSSDYGPASSSDVTVSADSAHSALVIKVLSPYGNTLVRWVATVRTTEVIN